MKTTLDQPFFSIGQTAAPTSIVRLGIGHIARHPNVFWRRQWLLAGNNGGHLVTEGHDLLLGSFRAASTTSQVLGLTLSPGVQRCSPTTLPRHGLSGPLQRLPPTRFRLDLAFATPGAGVRAKSSSVAVPNGLSSLLAAPPVTFRSHHQDPLYHSSTSPLISAWIRRSNAYPSPAICVHLLIFYIHCFHRMLTAMSRLNPGKHLLTRFSGLASGHR